MTPIVATTDAKRDDGNSAHEFGAFSLRMEHWHQIAKDFNSRSWRTVKDWAKQQFNIAASFGQFRIIRLTWNLASGSGALLGMKTIEIVDKFASDNPTRTLMDIRDANTVELMRKEEVAFHAEFGNLVDVREFGIGVLNENNFAGNPCPFSADDIRRYYEMMYSIWGRKLSLCVGGQLGGYKDKQGNDVPATPIALFFQTFRDGGPLSDKRPQCAFQDSYGASNWGSQYSIADMHLGYWPQIMVCEVEGLANQWDDLGRDVQALLNEFEARYQFLRNMGSWPDYAGADAIAERMKPHVAAEVERFHEWVGGVTQPGPIDPPPGDGGGDGGDPVPTPFQFPVKVRGGEILRAEFGGPYSDIVYPVGTTETVIPIPIANGERWNPRTFLRSTTGSDVWTIDPAEPSGNDQAMSFHCAGRDSAIVAFEGYEEPEPEYITRSEFETLAQRVSALEAHNDSWSKP